MADQHDEQFRRRNAREILERIEEAKRRVSDEGREHAREKMHDRGSLTARERVAYLCDSGTFTEYGQLVAPSNDTPEVQEWDRETAPADGIVTGIGDIDGRPTAVLSFDYTVMGGSMGDNGFKKMRRLFDLAMDNGLPVVMLHDGGGHRIQEGLDARPIAHGDPHRIWSILAKLSGYVPLVSAIMGPGFAGPTNFSSLCDFVPIVSGTGSMGIAGPPIVKAALGIDISMDDYGADFHTAETGMAHAAYDSDEACLDAIRDFLSYLPQDASEEPPVASSYVPPTETDQGRLIDVVPSNPKKGYDVHDVIEGVIDRDSFFEIQRRWARNIVIGFARIEGQSVGIVANNPRIKAGTLDADVSNKAPRFISLCDAFRIPVIFFVDVPGFLPGPDQEKQQIARHSGKFMYELGRATTPIINVVVRRGYGLGYLAMAGGRDANQLKVVWPTAEIAGMSIEGAVELVYQNEIEEADDPDARRQELIDKFTELTGPLRATEDMGVDAAIAPSETRSYIAEALERASDTDVELEPPKRHGIPPL